MHGQEYVRIHCDRDVATLIIDRPKALNALNTEVLGQLEKAVSELESRPPRCVIVCGGGDRAFVAGADIAEMERLTPIEARAFAQRGQRLFQRIEDFPAPVIASVRGYVLGGGLELALACDLIVAAEDAQFAQPEISLGILPGFGGTQRLARRVGLGMARYLIYTGARIAAREALQIGLVDRVVASADLATEVRKLAAELAAKPAFAMRLVKAVLAATGHSDFIAGCQREAEAFGLAFAHPDSHEGLRAFLEKRQPKFA